MLTCATFAIIRGNQEFIFYTITMLIMIAALLAIHARVHFTMPVLWALALWGLFHLAGGLVPVNNLVLYSYWLLDFGTFGVRYDHAIHAYGFATATCASWQALAAAMTRAQSDGCHGRCSERLCEAQEPNDQPESQPNDAPNTKPRVTLGIAIALIFMGTGLGALNEVIEFAATKLLPNTNVGGYENTAWDLVSNLTGATFAACLLAFNSRREAARSKPTS